MAKKVRHVLGISGGKDSAALAIYMKDNYPELDIEYYTCDTGKELEETYELIKNLEVYLGKKIIELRGAENSHEDPFDHYLKMFGGYLPSSNSRWCTKKLKLDPFENFVGNDPVISYVGIRGDEEREGYISKKPTIQSIFPFRKNIWSEDVITKVLSHNNISLLVDFADAYTNETTHKRISEILHRSINSSFTIQDKAKLLLDTDTKLFNKIVFQFLQTTHYPLAKETHFPLTENTDVLVRQDIFDMLESSGVGVPAYYKEVNFEINGIKSTYARSRSGCYFCFFQQKIEWIWLYEQHPDRFKKAMEYEKDGYTWLQNETLAELIMPDRVASIKEEYIKRTERNNNNIQSPYLLDILADAESEGCASCFI